MPSTSAPNRVSNIECEAKWTNSVVTVHEEFVSEFLLKLSPEAHHVLHNGTRIRRLQSRILLERIIPGVAQGEVVSNNVVDPPVCVGGLDVNVLIQSAASTIEVVDDGGVIRVRSANMVS